MKVSYESNINHCMVMVDCSLPHISGNYSEPLKESVQFLSTHPPPPLHFWYHYLIPCYSSFQTFQQDILLGSSLCSQHVFISSHVCVQTHKHPLIVSFPKEAHLMTLSGSRLLPGDETTLICAILIFRVVAN